jgi:hypothetical protein
MELSKLKFNVLEFLKHNNLNCKFKFDCYSDGMFEFSFKKDDILIQVSFICDDDICKTHTFEEIADSKGLTYLEFAFEGKGLSISFEYNKNDESSLNLDSVLKALLNNSLTNLN